MHKSLDGIGIPATISPGTEGHRSLHSSIRYGGQQPAHTLSIVIAAAAMRCVCGRWRWPTTQHFSPASQCCSRKRGDLG